MKITSKQKEAIEYLDKYTKWDTYGERNLEKDIITVLGLLKDLQNDNIRYEKELHDTLKYSISKQKIKDILEKLKNTNFNDYTNQQDGNEVKMKVLYEFIKLLESEK